MDCLPSISFFFFNTLSFFFSKTLSFFSSQSEKTKTSRLPNESSIRQPNCFQTDVLELILQRLAFIDIVRFGAVCSTWKTAVDSYISSPTYRPFAQAPWLLHSCNEPENYWRFFNPTETKFYNVGNCFGFAPKSWITGSLDDGWLLILEETSNTFLVNQFSRRKIQLPFLNTFITSPKVPDIRYKVVLGKNSSVAAIMICEGSYCWPKNLAFCKIGDNAWKPTRMENQSYLDIICHNDEIHALSSTGEVDIWDFLSPFPTKTTDFGGFSVIPIIVDQWLPFVNIYAEPASIAYLTKSLDEVLIVEQIMYSDRMQTSGFIVSKLDYKEEKRIPLQNLHGRAIFISPLSAISASALDCPELEGNLIYCDPKNYLAVYNLEEQKVKRYEKKLKTSNSEYFWVFPNP
ncbi:hypothetical protein FNV43_RR02469 [Rhamnella rubrinervis]|uniref:F-box domain-containing protein n=1 Tax=Rhamnella rubrinervis TaxID=2594499 RepID=A0A8K0HSN8_9ROSA|nr:hypothetical protein FNV43_RR02469 [Rhamnella rubrinervis]